VIQHRHHGIIINVEVIVLDNVEETLSVVLLILGDKLVEVRQARIVINDVVKEEADDMITIPAVVIMIGDQDLKISIGVDKYNLSRIKDLRQNPLQAKRSCHLGFKDPAVNIMEVKAIKNGETIIKPTLKTITKRTKMMTSRIHPTVSMIGVWR